MPSARPASAPCSFHRNAVSETCGLPRPTRAAQSPTKNSPLPWRRRVRIAIPTDPPRNPVAPQCPMRPLLSPQVLTAVTRRSDAERVLCRQCPRWPDPVWPAGPPAGRPWWRYRPCSARMPVPPTLRRGPHHFRSPQHARRPFPRPRISECLFSAPLFYGREGASEPKRLPHPVHQRVEIARHEIGSRSR